MELAALEVGRKMEGKDKTKTGEGSFLLAVLVLALTTVWFDVIEISDAGASAIEVFGEDLSAGFDDFMFPAFFLSLLLLCPLLFVCDRWHRWALVLCEIAAGIWLLLCGYVLIKFARNPPSVVTFAVVFEALANSPASMVVPEGAVDTLKEMWIDEYGGQLTVRWIAFAVIAVEYVAALCLFIFNMNIVKYVRRGDEASD